MARTIDTIFTDLVAKKESDINLATLNSTSKTAIWRLWLYIMAYCAWVLETIFDEHKAEVSNILAQLKPHTTRWYRNKALDFQFGFALIQDTDIFDNTEKTEEQIETSKIIKYAAVTEAVSESRLIIKIATEVNGKLAPIQPGEKAAFDAYVAEYKDAGVRVTVINYLPDILQLRLKIYYDPLLLTADGFSILNPSRKPVDEALKEFMKELPFDGELILASLIDKLQKTEGVKIPHLVNAATKWIDSDGNAYGNFENISVSQIPVSGYFEIEDFLNIEYIAKV
ncbi:nucleotidyltransferase [Chryseobacterium sp. H3056]|uniref:Nucleotidyltransferase n=1 Tax=Kaistella daneshvariae TaxID=2487074 RepID=A0A3N0WYQ5_9FLAO|nr:nucleotidyltransferase [Kaistella daneshvariae]ROI09801.1 nucleotidyltransferase [Kaistella daneshvariae]